MSALDLPAALAAEQRGFAALARGADPRLPVPGCAPWCVEDLVRHLAAIHRWAAACARTGPEGPLPDDEPFAEDAPDYPSAAAELRTALADPGRPCASFVGPVTAGWWTRRQVHETLVHRLDLAAALGVPAGADPRVAADCVAEVLDTMHPRQVRLGRVAPPRCAVLLTAPSGSWVLGPGEPVAEVAGPELALARLLWRRASLGDPRLAVRGDRGAAAEVLAGALTP
ncbi:maleylpyruvate isomerase family mycothiol-dependent enzyme [Geodermatophilus nigrescens]|uniref:TIGR03083 family protein n=1 Tax=Geodermatophilus nigrescens TaxID=1070870 RepID=A0A1M5E056_9ACTN|nr:maleylpyruvate isomerase family mycothiol-dependent enzyme [Geodermatophilus nigrescens]SHF72462.1 TIGR03083 family protein [Geodermatophilus nigrescens]